MPRQAALFLSIALLSTPFAFAGDTEPKPDAIFGGSELSQFFRAAESARVDVVGIGDSNQLFAGHGWDHGWILGVDERFGTYASSLLSLGENSGNSANAGVGFRIIATSSQGTFDYGGAPTTFDDFLTPDIGMRPLNYVYVADGESTTLRNHGLSLQPSGVLSSTEPLYFHISYATFASGSPGSFTPIVRLGAPPYSVLQSYPTLSLAGDDEITNAILPFQGSSTAAPIQVMLGTFNSTLNGPFVGYTIRAELPSADTGASFSSLYAFGGQSARDMADALQQASDAYLKEYFGQIRSLQGPDKFVMVRINSGLNDRNEDLPPLDGSSFEPSSPEAYAIHLNLIIERIRSIWTEAGWSQSELYFLLAPSHPVAQPDEAILSAYREKAREVSSQYDRCAVVDFTQLTDANEMLANGWYQSGGSDRNHLTEEAYEALALRELDALLAYTPCPDINGDGLTDLTDLNAVLASFGQASSANDLTGDGVVDIQDLNALLSAFGSPCSPSNHD